LRDIYLHIHVIGNEEKPGFSVGDHPLDDAGDVVERVGGVRDNYMCVRTDRQRVRVFRWRPSTLIERTPPPRGGFRFTMFSHQEPCLIPYIKKYSLFCYSVLRKNPPPPGGFPIYYVLSSKTEEFVPGSSRGVLLHTVLDEGT